MAMVERSKAKIVCEGKWEHSYLVCYVRFSQCTYFAHMKKFIIVKNETTEELINATETPFNFENWTY